MRLIAISGSLRTASSNGALLRAAALVAPAGVEVVLYDGIGELPHFNPDRDGDEPLAPVAAFRAVLRSGDGVLVSSPEYAHGVPGVLKNALDWVVGSGELVGKPVLLLNASPRSTYAQASLVETLTVMSATVFGNAAVDVPVLGTKLDAEGIATHGELGPALERALAAFVATIPGGDA